MAKGGAGRGRRWPVAKVGELAPVCLGRVGGTTLPSSAGEWRWGREGEILACPWHGWEFDLLTGEGLADRRRLRLYPVSVEDDTVFITI